MLRHRARRSAPIAQRIFVAIVAAVALLAGRSFQAWAEVDASRLTAPAAEARFFDLLNADRQANGQRPLVPDARLMELARWRSEDMLARDYFSHEFDGRTVFDEMCDRHIDFSLAGENLAYNTYGEDQTISVAETSLMNSPSHRENILREAFTRAGVGVALGPDHKAYYTQLFLKD